MKIKKIQIICVMGSLLLYGILKVAGGNGGNLRDGQQLLRNPHGRGETSYEVMVKGLAEEEVSIEIPVREKRYSAEEASELYETVMGHLDTLILGENTSLSEVRSDLNLISKVPEYGIKIRWISEKPEVLDSFGSVYNRQMKVESETVWLKAQLSDGTHEASYEIQVTVCPPLLTEKEAAVQGFLDELKLADERQQQSETLKLPLNYEGKELHYRENDHSNYEILLVLGVLLAVLCAAKERVDLRKQDKVRNRQLLLDYSELVSKLMVFIGAGMTIRIAWEKIAADYAGMQEEGRVPVRYAYEEMCRTCYQLRSGTPEGQAYHNFGRRCQLQPYLKLSSLLEQNRREGTKNLRNLLNIEMLEAFEQRKNLARKMGEEAGTKLLLPLFMMLGIVMVMIMVPAFLSFY